MFSPRHQILAPAVMSIFHGNTACQRDQVGGGGLHYCNLIITTCLSLPNASYTVQSPSFSVRKPSPATSHSARTLCQTVRRCRQGWRKYQPHLRSGTTILTCLSKLLLLSLCHITTVFSKIQNSCGLVMEEREAGSILYKCLFWLRSLITLHLNQRSQLECDWR